MKEPIKNSETGSEVLADVIATKDQKMIKNNIVLDSLVTNLKRSLKGP